ncbi:MAG: sigma-70 family polymerase sigma factor [Segetibacter sp.]|nr:sigma-70 family polymerase sigma factor [Segetibacter sp.]
MDGCILTDLQDQTNCFGIMKENSTSPDSSIINSCIAGNRKSQERLYNLLAPKMYAVCLKFFRYNAEAEDVLQEGFIKLFNNLHNYRGEGSFEGWVRRIFVNTSIQFYRTQKPPSICVNDLEEILPSLEISALDNLYEKDVIHFTHQLSKGYRTVFDLYAIQGYSHNQISQILGISESTSKSQHLRAKASMKKLIGERV